jgi:maleate isomerase
MTSRRGRIRCANEPALEDRVRIGVIFTPDNAADRDFWRWCPPDVSLHFTRTPLDSPEDEEGVWIPSDQELVDAVRTLVLIRPSVVTLACTSGSFAGVPGDEARIRRTMTDAGSPIALTTSGSLLDALHALGARSVAVATPYSDLLTARLRPFLEAAGYRVDSLVNEEPGEPAGLSDMTPEQLRDLALRADRPDADVLFLSCTALETYDLIGPLERELGKPVITSAQLTMWAALGAAGLPAVGAGQSLLDHAWAPTVGAGA